MKIYMIRHGQTDWNKTGKLQGQTDIPLNEAGRALAVKAGHALRDVPFTRVISSPLSRAVETAKLVLAAAGRVLPVEKDPRIEEISFGDLEGAVMKGTELSPEAEEFQAFFDAPEKYRPARNGETLEQLLKRTGDFLADLASSGQEHDTVLVSVHGACMRALQANILHNPVSEFWNGCVPPNCAVSVAVLEEGTWRLASRDTVYE